MLGSEHPDTLSSCNNMGGLLKRKDTGERTRAVALYEWALEARKRVLGRDHTC